MQPIVYSEGADSNVAVNTNSGASWIIDINSVEQIGVTHTVSMRMKSDTREDSPLQDYFFIIEVTGCYVFGALSKNEDLIDFTMSVGEKVDLPFEQFEQVPNCNFASSYTLTLL